MIDSKDITFIIAGLYAENCFDNIKTLRHVFPKSTIIVSTWNQVNIDLIRPLVDKILLSDEKLVPFSNFTYHTTDCPFKDTRINNYNKQLTLVQKALKEVTTKYCVKMRPDLKVQSADFLKYYNDNDSVTVLNKKFRFANKRILIPDTFTSFIDIPFAYSDIFQFGLTEDIRRIWNDAKIMDESVAMFFAHHNDPKNIMYFNHQYTAEQFLTLPIIKKLGLPIPSNYFDKQPIKEHLAFLVENFIVCNLKCLGIASKFDYDEYKTLSLCSVELYRALFQYYKYANKAKCKQKSKWYKILYFYRLRNKK